MFDKFINKIKKIKPTQYLVIFVALVIYIGAVVGVLNYRRQNQEPLVLVVDNASYENIYSANEVLISGRTVRGAKVKINDQAVNLDKDGYFSGSFGINNGEQLFLIVSERGGEMLEQKITVNKINTPKKNNSTQSGDTNKNRISSDGSLSSTGPESLWAVETGVISASLAAWSISRSRFRKSFRR